MNFIDKIRLNLGSSILRKRAKKLKRERGVFNFDSAKTIGVIFNATHQENFEVARKFIKELSDKGLKVNSLGFVDNKELLDFYAQQSGLKFFSKNNLNWYNKPKNPVVEEFTNKSFDILIDLSIEDYFPIQYIVGLSTSKFKVGRFSDKYSFYDFMIDIEKDKSFKFLIEQLKHYLNIINKK